MKKSSPRNARSFQALCGLKTDNYDTEDFWITVSEDEVTLCAQKIGEFSKAQMTIPKKDFNKLIDWYNREQVVKSAK